MAKKPKLDEAKGQIDNNRLRSIARQTAETFSEMIKTEDNIDFYAVFKKQGGVENPNELYTYIGKTKVKSFIDFDVQNGVQYWYAIVAVDKAGNMSCPGFPVAGESKSLVSLNEEDVPYEVTEGSGVFIVNGKIYRTGDKIPIIPGYTVEVPDNAFVQIKHEIISVPEATDVSERVYDSQNQTHTFKETKGAFVWEEKFITDPTEVKSHLPVVIKADVRFASKGYRPQLFYRRRGEENWTVAPMQRGTFDQYKVGLVDEVESVQLNNIKIEKLNSYIGSEIVIKPLGLEVREKEIEFVFDMVKPQDQRYAENLQVTLHLMHEIIYKIKEGDTWSIISQKFGVREFDLKKYNNNVSIQVGGYVKIPSGSEEEYHKVEMSYDMKISKETGKQVFYADKSKWKEINDKMSDNEVKIKSVVTVNFGGLKNQYTSDMYSTIKGG